MSRLRTELGRIRLENPTVLASGILDETGGSMLRAAGAGAGALVTKSIGSEPRLGYPNPTVVEVDDGLINAVGLPNPGIAEFEAEMRVALKGGVPVVGSIFAGDAQGFADLALKMESYGAAALELNLSCPHVRDVGTEIGTDPVLVREITAAVKGRTRIPVFAKLAPNVPDIARLGEAAADGGADGITAINTVKAMAIVPELRRPLLGNAVGGLSGPPIKMVGLRAVYELRKSLDLPIMGVGGVASGMDAVEYIMAGANAVQLGTALKDSGVEVFRRICDEIERFMEAEGFASIKEMSGVAHG